MKHYLPTLTTLAMSLMSSAFIPSLKAGDENKQTTIAISEPVSVQGTILPAGKYVLRLEDPSSSRNLIAIFNGDGTRLITTVLAQHAYRLEPTGESEFEFYKSPADSPPLCILGSIRAMTAAMSFGGLNTRTYQSLLKLVSKTGHSQD